MAYHLVRTHEVFLCHFAIYHRYHRSGNLEVSHVSDSLICRYDRRDRSRLLDYPSFSIAHVRLQKNARQECTEWLTWTMSMIWQPTRPAACSPGTFNAPLPRSATSVQTFRVVSTTEECETAVGAGLGLRESIRAVADLRDFRIKALNEKMIVNGQAWLWVIDRVYYASKQSSEGLGHLKASTNTGVRLISV